jgi:hypothetical protein
MLSLVGIAGSGLTDHTLFNIQLGILFWLLTALLVANTFFIRKRSDSRQY